MALVSLQNVSVAFGGPSILENITLHVERSERVCLLGVNGAGKSTLMRILSGDISPDDGRIIFESGTRVAMLRQDVPEHLTGTVFDITAQGLGESGKVIAEFHRLTEQHDSSSLARLHELQHTIEENQWWPIQQSILKSIAQVSLDSDVQFAALSGGMKRRALLAGALAKDPELLLLDEPTNHLDIDAISWLEDFLSRFNGSVLFVTHDRTFLKKTATRIVELDRGRLTNWDCNYSQYLDRKQSLLEAEEKQWANFDKKLGEEEAWIRRGIKARRTRNEGRVRALQKMRQDRKERRERLGNVSMQLQHAEKSGRLVVDARNISFGYEDGPALVDNFSLAVQRGERIGIMGANGTGKTTLLNLLLKKITPLSGEVRLGAKLEIAYFDQLRSEIDESRTVWENVVREGDSVIINGAKKHVIGYLRDFLFTAERVKTPVRGLSGGERNRLLLAKLFSRPSNVLVFDEPTNDLDINTLELLEDLLGNYDGTILLVSHDRTFLNNVVTYTLAFEPNGLVREFAGGYDDWAANRAKPVKKKKDSEPPKQRPSKKKLSYKETRELAELPSTIELLEARIEQIQTDMADSAVYSRPGAISELKSEIEQKEALLCKSYARWEELEQIANPDS